MCANHFKPKQKLVKETVCVDKVDQGQQHIEQKVSQERS